MPARPTSGSIVQPRHAESLVQAFAAFLAAAQPLCARQQSGASTEDFMTFVGLATPLAVAHLKASLLLVRARARLASRWWTPHDLLLTAGLCYVENAYTCLMAWALDPATDPETAVARQRAWLHALGLEGLCDGVACEPITQLVTGDGIPDLVLRYPGGIVVVEAKTGTTEHAAPSGAPQTLAYAAAVRDQLGLPAARVEVVFITPDGDAAANPTARSTAFAGFALALAEVLDGRPLSPEAKGAFGILFTHFLSCSAGASATRRLIEQLARWADLPNWDDDAEILGHMKSLQAGVALFRLEEVR